MSRYNFETLTEDRFLQKVDLGGLRYPLDEYPVERKQMSVYGDTDGPEILVQMSPGTVRASENPTNGSFFGLLSYSLIVVH